MGKEPHAFVHSVLTCFVVVKHQHDLIETEQILELILKGLTGSLSPIGDRQDRPVRSGLPDGQCVHLALGNHDSLAASEVLLPE